MFFIKKVLILFGGNSTEHYVSCKSCKSIIENIDKKLFKYEVAGIDFDNTWYKFSDDLFYLEEGSWKEANILKIDNVINYLKEFYYLIGYVVDNRKDATTYIKIYNNLVIDNIEEVFK